MQMRKQQWKKLRREQPCRQCNHDHPTGQCIQRNGRRRALNVSYLSNSLTNLTY